MGVPGRLGRFRSEPGPFNARFPPPACFQCEGFPLLLFRSEDPIGGRSVHGCSLPLPEKAEAALKKEPVDQFRVLNLVVHGFAHTQYPKRSALALFQWKRNLFDRA